MKNFEVNDRVIELMKKKGVNELQLAEMLDKPASSIYRITNKSSVPTRATLQLIADAYGCDVSYFYGAPLIANAKIGYSDEVFWKNKYEELFALFNKVVGNSKHEAFELAAGN